MEKNNTYLIFLAFLCIILTLITYIRNEGQTDVYIIKYNNYKAFNETERGIISEFKANHVYSKIKINIQNMNGNKNKILKFKQELLKRNKGIIISIGTDASCKVKKLDKKYNIITCAVTDPIAAGIVNKLENQKENITGVTDKTPIIEQLNMIYRVRRNPKVLGLIYNPSDISSKVQVKAIKDICSVRNLKVLDVYVKDDGNRSYIDYKSISKCDVVYVPTDITASLNIRKISKFAAGENIPVVGSEKYQVENGANICYGIDYYNLGKQTGDMAIRLIDGGNAKNIPFESQKRLEITRRHHTYIQNTKIFH